MPSLLRIARRPWLLVLVVLLLARVAHARPGGGGGFSSGSSGSSDDGGIELIIDLIWLLLQIFVNYPQIGIPVVCVVVVAVVVWRATTAHGPARYAVGAAGVVLAGLGVAFVPNFLYAALGLLVLFAICWVMARNAAGKNPGWTVGTSNANVKSLAEAGSTAGSAAAHRSAGVATVMKCLEKEDPDFSRVLLRDFFYALFAEAQTARGQQQLARLSPYLGPEARATLEDKELTAVRDVIIGGMQLADGSVGDDMIRLEVAFEVNLTEVKGEQATSFYQELTWYFERKRGLHSRPPSRVRSFDCPNCGAPLPAGGTNVCSHCAQAIDTGQFDWILRDSLLTNAEVRPPILTADVAEAGNDLPSVVDPDLAAAREKLKARGFVENDFRARVHQLFDIYQAAWRDQKDEPLRPFVSARYFDLQHRWLVAYRAQGLRNVTDQAQILHMQLVRAQSDKYFDAITVRLFASSLDYTEKTSDHSLVSGSKSSPRRYTEYWTLVRSAEQPSGEAKCPHCGAPLVINMGGACSYCKTKVEAGQFDWVLSEIEQDETYSGS